MNPLGGVALARAFRHACPRRSEALAVLVREPPPAPRVDACGLRGAVAWWRWSDGPRVIERARPVVVRDAREAWEGCAARGLVPFEWVGGADAWAPEPADLHACVLLAGDAAGVRTAVALARELSPEEPRWVLTRRDPWARLAALVDGGARSEALGDTGYVLVTGGGGGARVLGFTGDPAALAAAGGTPERRGRGPRR